VRWLHLSPSEVTFLRDTVHHKLLKSVHFSLIYCFLNQGVITFLKHGVGLFKFLTYVYKFFLTGCGTARHGTARCVVAPHGTAWYVAAFAAFTLKFPYALHYTTAPRDAARRCDAPYRAVRNSLISILNTQTKRHNSTIS